jgi:hypothetical protein
MAHVRIYDGIWIHRHVINLKDMATRMVSQEMARIKVRILVKSTTFLSLNRRGKRIKLCQFGLREFVKLEW